MTTRARTPAEEADFQRRLSRAREIAPEVFAIAAAVRDAGGKVAIACIHDTDGELLMGRCSGDHGPIPPDPTEQPAPAAPYRGRAR